MILKFRVSLPGIKGFARVYELKSTTTLYEFHKIMRDDMNFPHDQLIQFKGLDADGELVARYGMFDLGAGAADEVSVADTGKKGIASFCYFYNATDRKSVIVTYEGEVEPVPGRIYPALVEQKGPDPEAFENGNVAYEDLPDDQKHLPGENPGWGKDAEGDDDDLEDIDLEEDDDDDDDDVKDKVMDDEEDIIFDGSEELTL